MCKISFKDEIETCWKTKINIIREVMTLNKFILKNDIQILIQNHIQKFDNETIVFHTSQKNLLTIGVTCIKKSAHE